MSSLARSWDLVKSCAAVLDADRELLAFPALAGLASLAAGVGLGLPAWLLVTTLPEEVGVPLGVLAGLVFAFVQSFVVIYFQAALVGAALIRMDGRDPTLGDGLGEANRRLGPILQWAAVSAVVGMVLQAMSKRKDGSTRTIPALAGMAWKVAVFLVVPVLVAEGVGPWDAVQRSATLLRKAWGEQLSGTVGLGAIFGLVGVAWLAVLGGLGWLAVRAEAWVALPVLVGVGVLGLLVVGLTHTAMLGVYRAAVYRYATQGDARLFDEGSLRIPG